MAKLITDVADIPFAQSFWQRYRVTLEVENRLCGGTPKSPDVIQKWIDSIVNSKSKTRELAEATRDRMSSGEVAKTATKDMEEAFAALTEEQKESLKKSTWNGFRSHGEGILIEGRQVKAMLKESANILSRMSQIWRFKNIVAETIFVEEGYLPIYRNGQPLLEPDADVVSTLHLEDRFGQPMSALKRYDYVEGPVEVRFHVIALNQPFRDKEKRLIAPEAITRLLIKHAGPIGLGAERSQGQGRFYLKDLERLEDLSIMDMDPRVSKMIQEAQ